MLKYRHFIRHPLCLLLSYKVIEKCLEEDQENIPSQSSNISLGGLLFPSKHPVDPKARIEIEMPYEDKVFNLKAQVVLCNHNSETNLYDIAVRFLRSQEAFIAKMIEQIYLIAGYRDMLMLQSGKEISLEEASRKWIKQYSARFERLYW
jgi:c-di-GMP-binding flagellar brake protein YcgR